ncbi:hypothetical protein FSP39_000847 [Pinctada imbricata]|uniref:Poly [ADP-ribose] polymerase n=1 Tax=Pinctada imbricata TaxID=66713 RepID=A0AA89C3Y0_PINIB|nr:hypothetical protein FSP39_000847 [Pinctada imbricata]
MATPAKKAKVTSLPVCPYGARCYRKNPQHLNDCFHPTSDGTSDTVTDTKKSKASTSSTPASLNDSTLPACKYGAKCYRKNLLHFAEYSHPTSVTSKKAESDDSGNDTDPVDSDDDKPKAKKKVESGDILKRGMSLVKSYSQMSEEERKELIKKAFEAKQKLQKELQETKDKMKEKDKELQNLQNEVNKGILFVEGEKEALEGTKTVYFTLQAERSYKEGSAAQTHFRLAESQFYRLLSSGYGASYKVSKVEYVVNPKLAKKFKQAREDIKKERGEDLSYPVLAFHGTKEENITPICEKRIQSSRFVYCSKNVKNHSDSGFAHRTDTGWYGKGVYFSEFPAYSMGYIQGAQKLLLCQVLPGKVFKCTKLIHGAALKGGYDSHTSPDGKELVIFNSHHIIPSYVVHYKQQAGDFQYSVSFRPIRCIFTISFSMYM